MRLPHYYRHSYAKSLPRCHRLLRAPTQKYRTLLFRHLPLPDPAGSCSGTDPAPGLAPRRAPRTWEDNRGFLMEDIDHVVHEGSTARTTRTATTVRNL